MAASVKSVTLGQTQATRSAAAGMEGAMRIGGGDAYGRQEGAGLMRAGSLCFPLLLCLCCRSAAASSASLSSSAPFGAPAAPELETLLLSALDDGGADFSVADSQEWLNAIGKEEQHEKLVPILSSLVMAKYIQTTPHDHSRFGLSAEGDLYRVDGSPEAQLWKLLPAEGSVAQKSLPAEPWMQLGLNQAMSKRWVEFEGDKKAGMLKRKVPAIVDDVQAGLQAVHEGRVDSLEKGLLELLKKRGLVATTTWKTYSISRGPSFARVRKVLATDLTMDMLKGDKWRDLDFKEYNFDAAGTEATHGALHPLMKVRAAFRQIFVEMGFEEMETNKYVESSFWNFDTLFQPQQHPARDAHDTFFVHQPAATRSLPEDYVRATQAMHESGGFGSIGYRYAWKREECEKNILRTHTTAVSSRMLYKLSQGPFTPRRYFSIDRVFRNETLDATHLAEFYQIEGLIADRNLTLGDLIGTISTFFKRIGITDVKFKPAYNPYTEPSMEIFGFSPQLNKWMELGNSGMFRPEMLRPMGLPEDVRVIAWGLGLERQTMLVYGIKHIRDLFGPKVKLNIIQQNPICRFDKHQQK